MIRPAFQFYPGDWRRKTALQACSIAARGLWIELICLAHAGTPYGHITLGNGLPIPTATLARMVGVSDAELPALLLELESAGIFSRNQYGGIFSRRMVRDEKLRVLRGEIGREHGAKGAEHGVKGGRPKKNPQGGGYSENPVDPVTEEPPLHLLSASASASALAPSETVPTEQGRDKPARASRKGKPREPNAYEVAWYDAMRAHYRTEPAKLAPHGSIALGRIGKSFGADAIAAKLRTLLADDRLRKYATPKYLEDNWNAVAAAGTLFSEPSHGLHPDKLARIRRVIAKGEPADKASDDHARWEIASQEVIDYKLTPEVLSGSN